MALFKKDKTFNLGIIIGSAKHSFLSFDEYIQHFLLPFSPRFRNIDFAVASLDTIGISDIIVFAEKDKDILQDYLSRGWPFHHFYVFDYADLREHFLPFFENYLLENTVEYISVLHGDYPVWFDMHQLLDQMDDIDMQAVKAKTISGNIYPALIVERSQFLKHYRNVWKTQGFDFAIDRIVNEQKIPYKKVQGYFMPIQSLRHYYEIHMNMTDDYLLLDSYNAAIPIKSKKSRNLTAIYKRHSHVRNSLIGEGAEVDGRLENSIVFGGAIVERGAVIKNSLIFPGNHIGHGAHIVNTIVDEFSEDNTIPNIGKGVRIGSENVTISNKDVPHLDFGVTLIGKDVQLPPRYSIGGNCYVESFTPLYQLKAAKSLKDGDSLFNKG